MAVKLLEAGIDVNTKNSTNGETCLHIACKDGDVEMARLLLQRGADANIPDNKVSSTVPIYSRLGL